MQILETFLRPGLTTRNKKLLGAKGIASRSKDATKNFLKPEALPPCLIKSTPTFLFGRGKLVRY